MLFKLAGRFRFFRLVSTAGCFLGLSVPLVFPAEASSLGRLAQPDWGKMPLVFEKNLGQGPAEFEYLARGPGYSILVGGSALEIQLERSSPAERQDRPTAATSRLVFEGAHSNPQVSGLERLPGKVQYYYGSDPARWLESIPTFAKVEVREIYPGVALLCYGNQGLLEFDLVLEPGADPRQVRMSFQGADELVLTEAGELKVIVDGRDFRLRKPLAYQLGDRGRAEIAGEYLLLGPLTAGFRVEGHDVGRTLVIDPVVDYSSYLGGSDFESANGIAVDGAGLAVVTGETRSSDFPLQSALTGSAPGGFRDVFVTKFNAAGDGVVYSTYLGGPEDDLGYAVAVDAAGNAYVTGEAEEGFPVTQGSLQSPGSGSDLFVVKLAPDGTLAYAAVFGGNQPDRARGIDVDSSGNAFIAGQTGSTNFPVTQGVVQPQRGGSQDAFVAQLNSTGSALIYSTYLGGGSGEEAFGVAVDSQGAAWVVGETNSRDASAFPTTEGALQTDYGGGLEDGFVAKLASDASALLFSSYLGGSSSDRSLAVDVDAAGNAYATGETVSADFPILNALDDSRGTRDAFVAKFTDGGQLVYSTFFGGGGAEEGRGIVVNSEGVVHLTGETTSADFPEVDPLPEGATSDLRNAFVAVLSADGDALLFSSGLGGSEDDGANAIALDAQGNVYLAGATESPDFPVASFQGNLAGGLDAFVTKIGGLVTQTRQLFFAQFGDGDAGGGLSISSLITLYNLSSTFAANVAVEINDDFGNPLTVDLNGAEAPGVLDGLVIPPDGVLSLETDGAGDVQAGAVTVSSDQELAGVILFRGFGVAGVGASERLQRMRAPITVGSGLNSGLAFMGLGTAQTIQLELRDQNGTLVATASLDLAARGHSAQFVTQFNWDTPPDFSNFSGTVTAVGESDFAATVILMTAAEFATLPVSRLIRN